MKVEGEAVTFCPLGLCLDGGICFDRSRLPHCHMVNFAGERSHFCRGEQEYDHIEKYAPERRPADYGSEEDLHQLDMQQAAAERNQCHHNNQYHDDCRLGTARSRISYDDEEKLLLVAAERGKDNQGGPYTKNHHYHSNGVHEYQVIEYWERSPNIVFPSCCAVSSSSECVEDGSSRVLAEAESLPFCDDLWGFSVTAMANSSRLIVGYALNAKKAESFVKPALVAGARSKGIVFSVIDCEKPLLDQGPFDVILHKITGELWHQQLKAYKQNNPKVLIFDPPEAIKKVYNRKSMLQEVADLNFQHAQGRVGVPKQLVVEVDCVSMFEEVARENLRYPLVAKPLWIDGTAKSHALSLAFDDSGLSSLTVPLVLQEFVNHGGVMFKVFVIGHLIKVVHRPSLSDVHGDQARKAGVITFPRVSSAAALAAETDCDLGDIEYPPEEMLSSLSMKLRSRLGLNLFNLDMIRESGKTNQFYVIDINYFPGFGKMPNYEAVFIEFLSSLASAREGE